MWKGHLEWRNFLSFGRDHGFSQPRTLLLLLRSSVYGFKIPTMVSLDAMPPSPWLNTFSFVCSRVIGGRRTKRGCFFFAIFFFANNKSLTPNLDVLSKQGKEYF
ncbi:Hypothetical protein Minf_1606 [Methylacidiphilum infernorum V4]|uniref:Uncharacterized protein n=1 Tax=Methylacidiphilum infernorum (isolate V4) TaxID=481448 RepID=B3DWF7_METI4|nr:Hypothetical protein Minf_1606 [Methylacidiphilum infernorum V4]